MVRRNRFNEEIADYSIACIVRKVAEREMNADSRIGAKMLCRGDLDYP